MTFVINLIKKYKSNLGYKILSQLENEDESDLKKVTKNSLDTLFDIDLDDEFEQ